MANRPEEISFASQWAELESALSSETSAAQRQQYRRLFYGGAFCFLGVTRRLAAMGTPEDAAIEALRRVSGEIDEFMANEMAGIEMRHIGPGAGERDG